MNKNYQVTSLGARRLSNLAGILAGVLGFFGGAFELAVFDELEIRQDAIRGLVAAVVCFAAAKFLVLGVARVVRGFKEDRKPQHGPARFVDQD